jgi:hypothetical protein
MILIPPLVCSEPSLSREFPTALDLASSAKCHRLISESCSESNAFLPHALGHLFRSCQARPLSNFHCAVDVNSYIIAIANVKKMRGRFISMFSMVGFRSGVLTTLNVFPRSICQSQRNCDEFSRSRNSGRSPSPSKLAQDRILDLLKSFVDLHSITFYRAAISCIAMQGGAKTFDFQGHVMLVGLRYRNQNFVGDPNLNLGTAFSFLYAEAVPITELLEEVPTLMRLMQGSEDKYGSVGEVERATMGKFVGVLRMLYWADGLVVFSDVGIAADHVTDCEGWESRLQFAIDNGVVPRIVDDTIQEGKIVKQGSRWKWVQI